MKRSELILRILTHVAVTLLIIMGLSGAAFWAVRSFGREALYDKALQEAPVLETKDEESVTSVTTEDIGTVTYEGVTYHYNEDLLTFLVMGVDSLEPLPEADEVTDYTLGGQADTLFLVTANPHTREIFVVAINRNSMAEVDVYSPENEYVRTDLLQICLQHGYGSGLEDSCERQVAAVSRMFYELPIHGYVSMNMAAIPILNDSVGGVRLEVLENVPWGTEAIAEGAGKTVTLEGMDAYYYLQYRDVEVFDSASMRLARQKQYLTAFASQAIERTKENVTFPLTVYDKISDYMVTDIGTSELTYLATELIGYTFRSDTIYTLEGETVTGGGGFEEFNVDDDALYELILELFYEPEE